MAITGRVNFKVGQESHDFYKQIACLIIKIFYDWTSKSNFAFS